MSEEEKDRIEEDNHAAIEEHNMDSQQDMPQEASDEQVTEKHDENDLSKLEATAHALEEEKQRYMRLQADFANYKKKNSWGKTTTLRINQGRNITFYFTCSG